MTAHNAPDPGPRRFWYSFGLQPTARLMGTWGGLAANVLTMKTHGRREWPWTEEEFNIARDQLAQAGYEIRECTRVPYGTEEVVS